MVTALPGADEPDKPAEVEYSIIDPKYVDSGLTSKGQAVTYVEHDRGEHPCRSRGRWSDRVHFSVDKSSGEATFNLNDQLDHRGTSDDGEILRIQNLGQFVQASVTDADGDTATGTFPFRIIIQVENDVPTTDADDASLINDIGGSTTESFNNLPGADEEISFLITFNLTEGAPVMSDAGQQMTSEGIGLVWQIDSVGNLQAVKSGAPSVPIFTLTADKAGGAYTGNYTVNITGPIDNGSQTISYTLSSVSAGNTATIEIKGSSPQGTIYIYGQSVTPANGTINSSIGGGIGIDNNFMNPGEVLSFEFYADVNRTTPLALTALAFSVDSLADLEKMFVSLWNDDVQIGEQIELTGGVGNEG